MQIGTIARPIEPSAIPSPGMAPAMRPIWRRSDMCRIDCRRRGPPTSAHAAIQNRTAPVAVRIGGQRSEVDLRSRRRPTSSEGRQTCQVCRLSAMRSKQPPVPMLACTDGAAHRRRRPRRPKKMGSTQRSVHSRPSTHQGWQPIKTDRSAATEIAARAFLASTHAWTSQQ